MRRSPDRPPEPQDDPAAAYTPVADVLGEPTVEGDDDAVASPGGSAFASPGQPAAGGGPDPTAGETEPPN